MPINGVAIRGAGAAERVRAIPVTPAAAERSFGSTTATTYDWRAGTSIELRLKRAKSTSAARGRLGMSGSAMSRMFPGMWVNTMVRISPMRAARRAATNEERPASTFATKNSTPRSAGCAP